MGWLANTATEASMGAVSFAGGVGVERIELRNDGSVGAVTTTDGATIEVGPAAPLNSATFCSTGRRLCSLSAFCVTGGRCT